MTDIKNDLWVFGYGSLMWKPGFDYVERRRARLPGYVRRFCLDSITYRGTPEAPGLVLALDEEPNGYCEGVAFRVAADVREETHAYLRARELITYSYLEKFLPLSIEGEVEAPGLCYVMDRSHVQYHGGLSLEQQAEVIATAVGPAGSNAEYLMNTVEQLKQLGVHDADMAHIADLVSARS
ncbi:MAG: gamma-glutamylcyclotransferase [Pikeienuella sp.]